MTVGKIILVAFVVMLIAVFCSLFPSLALDGFQHAWRGIYNPEQGLNATIIAAAIAGLLTLYGLKVAAGINLRNKRADVTIHCNTRYIDLYGPRHELLKEYTAANAAVGKDRNDKLAKYSLNLRSYLKRYWGLKSDQFDHWLAGYIDQETFVSWVVSTAEALSTEDAPEIRYREHLIDMELSNAVVNQRFVNLIEFVDLYVCAIKQKELRYTAILQYLRNVEKLEKRLIRQLAQDHFSRVWVAEFARTLKRKYAKAYSSFVNETQLSQITAWVSNIWETGLLDVWHHRMAKKNLIALEANIRSRYPDTVDARAPEGLRRMDILVEKLKINRPRRYINMRNQVQRDEEDE